MGRHLARCLVNLSLLEYALMKMKWIIWAVIAFVVYKLVKG